LNIYITDKLPVSEGRKSRISATLQKSRSTRHLKRPSTS